MTLACLRHRAAVVTCCAVLGAACGGGDDDGASVVTSAAATVPTTAAPPTTAATTTTAAPPTTAATTTTMLPPGVLEQLELGRSVQGRPIIAIRRGTPGGMVVLVIGVIHGDEDAGVAIVDRLATAPVPPGIDLWLVESSNPDGHANGTRQNANRVDLNRNYPHRWAPLGQPGDWQYGGSGPVSEPETAAMVAFIERIRPALAIWYHQDLFRIAPANGRAGEIRRRYAELTGLPVVPITGGTYTGTAATWQRQAVPEGVTFIVELGPSLSPVEADAHASAVFTIATGG